MFGVRAQAHTHSCYEVSGIYAHNEAYIVKIFIDGPISNAHTSSMSICCTCHVPYTKRDIYALSLSQYAIADALITTAFDAKAPRTVVMSRRPPDPVTDSPVSSNTSAGTHNAQGMTVPALLQRIHDLEVAVAHRDGQIQEWRRYELSASHSRHIIAAY